MAVDIRHGTQKSTIIFSRPSREMDDDILRSVIENGIKSLLNHEASRKVRRDVVETIRRKTLGYMARSDSVLDSDPSAANRAKYERTLAIKKSEPKTDEMEQTEEDDFADEFSEGEMVHSSEAARKLAMIPAKPVETIRQNPKGQETSRCIENAEELDDSLADPTYDAIQEPSDCDIRVYGQTEVCDSGEGARKSESRWVVTLLNGFIKPDGSDDEILFRTSNLTRPHIHQT
jgi:hypothetical protein